MFLITEFDCKRVYMVAITLGANSFNKSQILLFLWPIGNLDLNETIWCRIWTPQTGSKQSGN